MAGTVYKPENEAIVEQIEKEAAAAAKQLLDASNLQKGQIVIVGCSSSEVVGRKVGSHSTPEVGIAIYKGLQSVFGKKGIYIAAQCCEHLNRAVVVERDAVPYADIVNVVPQAKAGGSFATACYNSFKSPVVLESIKADAGLDIGLTLIGMHLKAVAVPLRLEQNRIGDAIVTAARVRPKFIGGDRAAYCNELK